MPPSRSRSLNPNTWTPEDKQRLWDLRQIHFNCSWTKFHGFQFFPNRSPTALSAQYKKMQKAKAAGESEANAGEAGQGPSSVALGKRPVIDQPAPLGGSPRKIPRIDQNDDDDDDDSGGEQMDVEFDMSSEGNRRQKGNGSDSSDMPLKYYRLRSNRESQSALEQQQEVQEQQDQTDVKQEKDIKTILSEAKVRKASRAASKKEKAAAQISRANAYTNAMLAEKMPTWVTDTVNEDVPAAEPSGTPRARPTTGGLRLPASGNSGLALNPDLPPKPPQPAERASARSSGNEYTTRPGSIAPHGAPLDLPPKPPAPSGGRASQAQQSAPASGYRAPVEPVEQLAAGSARAYIQAVDTPAAIQQLVNPDRSEPSTAEPESNRPPTTSGPSTAQPPAASIPSIIITGGQPESSAEPTPKAKRAPRASPGRNRASTIAGPSTAHPPAPETPDITITRVQPVAHPRPRPPPPSPYPHPNRNIEPVQVGDFLDLPSGPSYPRTLDPSQPISDHFFGPDMVPERFAHPVPGSEAPAPARPVMGPPATYGRNHRVVHEGRNFPPQQVQAQTQGQARVNEQASGQVRTNRAITQGPAAQQQRLPPLSVSHDAAYAALNAAMEGNLPRQMITPEQFTALVQFLQARELEEARIREDQTQAAAARAQRLPPAPQAQIQTQLQPPVRPQAPPPPPPQRLAPAQAPSPAPAQTQAQAPPQQHRPHTASLAEGMDQIIDYLGQQLQRVDIDNRVLQDLSRSINEYLRKAKRLSNKLHHPDNAVFVAEELDDLFALMEYYRGRHG